MYKTEWPSFDELKRWAEHSPERLEAFRSQEIEAIISSAPEHLQRRLRGLQFQVNCQRQLHKSPMGSCIAISKMMHQSLNRLQEALSDLREIKGLRELRKDKRNRRQEPTETTANIHDNVVSLF